MKINKKEITALIEEAKKVRKYAFSHRSEHKIGASVLTYDGEIFGGCNIESVISGLGTCAERSAINHAVVHGKYRIKAICTVDKHFTPSCGACLQYALLFSQVTKKDIIVINADLKGKYELDKLSHLLPEGYKTENKLRLIQSYGKE
ncbi:cytidine deaminase [candidate division KSB1 bacterium]